MDDLLRYALFDIAIKLLLIELVLISGCLVAVICIKIYAKIQRSRNLAIQTYLKEAISNHLTGAKELKRLRLGYRDYKNVLLVLEEFNRKITDDKWVELRNQLQTQYLLQTAKAYLHKSSWIKRQLAARCYLLNHESLGKDEIEKLLHDEKFLIRVIAAQIILKTHYKDLFFDVINTMSKETELTRYPYRDAIITSDFDKFEWIEEMLQSKPSPSVSAICLDLLSTRTTKNIFTSILPYIYGDDQQCRLLAIKILKSIPSGESQDVILHCLKDEDWEVRVEALKSLNIEHTKEWLPIIRGLLHDSVWFVRLQAALTLKNMGKEGLQVLSEQNPKKEPDAYQIARYVLASPSFGA